MNNVFLYATRDSKLYRQVEGYLVNLSFDGKLVVLPPGSQFSSPLCLQLRSNDIVILFAETDEDVDKLIAMRNEYENYKIILITKNEEHVEGGKLMVLSPRFIAYLDNNIEGVLDYIINIFRKS